jgi:hypothetical protein
MVRQPIIHKDRFGRELGNDTVVVAATGTREIDVCTIVSQGEKMVRVQPIGKKSDYLRYPNELIVINDIPETMLYVFKA